MAPSYTIKSFYLDTPSREVEAIRPQRAGHSELHRRDAAPDIPLLEDSAGVDLRQIISSPCGPAPLTCALSRPKSRKASARRVRLVEELRFTVRTLPYHEGNWPPLTLPVRYKGNRADHIYSRITDPACPFVDVVGTLNAQTEGSLRVQAQSVLGKLAIPLP